MRRGGRGGRLWPLQLAPRWRAVGACMGAAVRRVDSGEERRAVEGLHALLRAVSLDQTLARGEVRPDPGVE